MQQLEGDPKLFNAGDGSELVISGGQPVMDTGLENAVYLSLFSAPWWGNAISEPAEQLTSRFEELNTRTLTNQARLDAGEFVRQALAWMVIEGIAQSVTVNASIAAVGVLALVITIQQPDDATRIKYKINWQRLELLQGDQ
jgi:phage gp46-like protein